MAMPRRASAGASSRSAIRLSAPEGSPDSSALAAAVMSESMAHFMPRSCVTKTRHSCYSPFGVAEAKLRARPTQQGLTMTTHEVVSTGGRVEAKKHHLAKEAGAGSALEIRLGTRPEHGKNGSRPGSSYSRRRRSSRGVATSWRGSDRNCRGFGSTRSIDSRPTRGTPR